MDFDQLLSKLIDDAAQRFGPRCKAAWTIKPVLSDGDNFPETIVDDERCAIRVRITKSTRTDQEQARYQLSHESIHCLLATGRRDTIYFEEGLANFYALNLPSLSRNYRRFAKKELPKLLATPYRAFLAINPTDDKIRDLREELPNMDQLEASLVEKHFGISRSVADAVCQRMTLGRPETM